MERHRRQEWEKILRNRITFSLSEFNISVVISFTLASPMTRRVTLRKASSIRYLNASTWLLSKTHSLTSHPRSFCFRVIRASTFSSFFVLSNPPTTLSLPYSFLGITNDMAIPECPARAVRPTRWVYEREVVGRSKFKTHETETKSMPRDTPYSLSDLWTRLCFLRAGGGEGERFRFWAVDTDSSKGGNSVSSLWVAMSAHNTVSCG